MLASPTRKGSSDRKRSRGPWRANRRPLQAAFVGPPGEVRNPGLTLKPACCSCRMARFTKRESPSHRQKTWCWRNAWGKCCATPCFRAQTETPQRRSTSPWTSCYLGRREVPVRKELDRPSQQGADAGAPDGAQETLKDPGPVGSLDKEVIRQVIRHKISEIRSCYERALDRNHSLLGRISVLFKIEPNGRIVASGIQSSTMNSDELEECVGHAVCNWEFPRPFGGGMVIVSYPFNFTSGGGPR
jgi:hypothetical protein